VLDEPQQNSSGGHGRGKLSHVEVELGMDIVILDSRHTRHGFSIRSGRRPTKDNDPLLVHTYRKTRFFQKSFPASEFASTPTTSNNSLWVAPFQYF
jgi:hypothetical protein